MSARRQRGATLVVGLILLTIVTLLGLAGASAAHVELALAQNELFRENAVSAASAGIEFAIGRIVTTSDPAVSVSASAQVPGGEDYFETTTRFAGLERALPQAPGAALAGAHFEIISVGHSARRAIDRQRAEFLLVVDAPAAIAAADCEPLAPGVPCHRRGELLRLSWQRAPAD